MEPKRNVFLVGPMGAGKSTVGKIVAEQLGLDFLDSDREIEARTGADIAWIFDVEGEQGFRDREEAILDELTARNGVVVATGGGAIVRPETRKRLISRGIVIYLESPLSQQVERTGSDKRRPLLRNGEPQEILGRLQEERDPLYREAADLVFKADRRSARALAHEIVRKLSGEN
jgi:shikimate kinase